MVEVILVFVVLLLVAALVYAVAGWLGMPHPIPAILAAIVVVLAIAYLIVNLDIEDADALTALLR